MNYPPANLRSCPLILDIENSTLLKLITTFLFYIKYLQSLQICFIPQDLSPFLFPFMDPSQVPGLSLSSVLFFCWTPTSLQDKVCDWGCSHQLPEVSNVKILQVILALEQIGDQRILLLFLLSYVSV